MGKIRIRTLGDESAEKEVKKEAKVKKEQKKSREEAAPDVILSETKDLKPTVTKSEDSSSGKAETQNDKKRDKNQKKTKARQRSKNYKKVKALIDQNKQYKLSEALLLLPQLKLSKFDETVELHINTSETGVSGMLTLPHGTGKKIRVAVADDKVIAEIEKGKIEFDVLVAEPQMMAKLAKVAKILGPRGLMPNPKNGTVTSKPEDVVKKYEGGQMHFKTESKAPVIHLTVGKLSFGDKKLTENIQTVIQAITPAKIQKVVLKSTMSPGIKIDLAAA